MKKFVSLFLSVLMMASVLCTTASASYYEELTPPTTDPTAYYLGELAYRMDYSDVNGNITTCEIRYLSSAQRISTLVDMIYPAERLENELTQLERFLDEDYVRYSVYRTTPDGMRNLDSYLSEETRSALSVMYYENAIEFMQIMKVMPEYAEYAGVRDHVDSYLRNIPDGREVAWTLNALSIPGMNWQSSCTDYTDLGKLIERARAVVDTAEYQNLAKVMSVIRSGNADNYSLTCRFTPTELCELWRELVVAADYYWPHYVRMLNEMTIVVPVGTISAPVEEAPPIPETCEGAIASEPDIYDAPAVSEPESRDRSTNPEPVGELAPVAEICE